MARNQTDNIFHIGRQFVSKICGYGACRPFNKLFEKGTIHTYQRLGRGLILRYLALMRLCEMKARHFDTRIHQKTIVEIRTHHATHTTLPIIARTKKVWRRRTVPPPTRYSVKVDRQRKKDAENCRGHSILRESSGHDSVNGVRG